VTKDLLNSIFAPTSPLHDGAALIQEGRIAAVGCILPLTLKTDLPEGVGTRHRAAVGITEETDAVVIVVSEETGTISIVMAGEMLRGLDAPHLRVALREILANERRELPTSEEIARPLEVAEANDSAAASKFAGMS
jgi:diadenylate cyclase